ncbi:MAG TPA: hypothetical protein VGV86_02905 [Acidimicrobiales bacterium]|nr:hypothetical protein [Acidimicrobiales bacterium]
MNKWLTVLAISALLAAACGSDGDDTAAPTTAVTEAPPTSASVTTVTAAPATSAAPTTRPSGATSTTRAGQTAARAVIEPQAVAGIQLGANKSQVIAILGPPTTQGQETDISGKKYDYLRWQFSGNRGLFLNFRTESVTSPLLTDWIATAPGPSTKAGVQVGDGQAKVTAAHGPLQAFCCESQVASVSQGGGRMIVVVADDSKTVIQIIGGDPAFWSRSIAD